MMAKLWLTSALGYGVLAMIAAQPAMAQADPAPLPAKSTLAQPTVAGAQPVSPPADAPSTASAPAASNQVAEIIVTANRRSESLSRVGVSVTAIGADTLARQNIKSADDLVKLVPGFTVTQSYGGAEVFTLRGVGFNSPNASATSPVGVYVDEAALPYPYMATGVFFDLDRVEVLKGPQGTLYGRNTTGGLINYITAKPTADFHTGGSLEIGNYSTVNGSAYASGPINDWVRFRVAVDSQNRFEGYQKSVTTGATLGEFDQHAIRATFDFGNGGPLDVSVTGTYWNKRGDTLAPQAIAVIVNSPFLLPSIPASVIKPTSNTQADFLQSSNQPLAAIGRYHPDPITNSDFGSIIVNAAYAISPNLKIVSLTSYDDLSHRDASDAEGTNTESVFIAASGTIQSFSEELRLLGDYGKFKWSVGGYYARDLLKDDDLGYIAQNSTIAGLRFLASILPHPGISAQQIALGFGNFHDLAHQTTTVKAGFANGEYKFNDLLKFTAGGRITEDSNDFSGCTYDTGGTNAYVVNPAYPAIIGVPVNLQPNACYTLNAANTGFVPIVNRSQDKTNFSWHVNVDVTPSPTTLYYGSISRGFKAGVFPILAASNEVQFAPVQQEELTAYEVGTKLGLFERRVQVNVAGFYYDYTNKQVYGRVADLIFGTLTRIRNIPSSREYGFEGDVTWRINSVLTATAAATYLNSRIGDYTDFNDLGQLGNRVGNPFAYTPKYQGNASLVYDAPLNDRFRLNASVDADYQDVSHGDIADLQILKIKSRTLFGATLGIAPTHGNWTAGLYVKNLLDTYYYTGTATAIETAYRYPGLPRQFGVRVAYKY